MPPLKIKSTPPSQPVPIVEKGKWKAGNILVHIENDDGSFKMTLTPSLVMGRIAVHDGIGNNGKGLYAVTSANIGLVLCHVSDINDGFLIGEIINDDPQCAKAMALGTAKLIIEHLPEWFKPWLTKCHKAHKFVDPLE